MYDVRGEDRARELAGIPQSSVGAPLPIVLSAEHRVVVAYLMQDATDATEARDSSAVRVVSADRDDEAIALLTFLGYHAFFFGPPNDETLAGHPLAHRGLRPYGSYVVEPSSWVHRLERMSSVHPQHDPKRFDELRHFILTFHDSTFECVARSFTVEVHAGSIPAMIPRMTDVLFGAR